MTTARFIVGDSLTVLRGLPDASVDVVITSPPFLALRSYLPPDHPDKALEMGSEPTPGEFLDALLDVIEECRRVLAPHGSLCVELGDTYSGAGGYGSPDSPNPAYGNGERFTERWEGKTAKRFKKKDDGWPEAKSLVLVPELFRFALAYGFNPLTGRTLAPWRIRNVVRWCRPNPPVGALGDKFRPATSDIAVACMSKTRYFDLDAVRLPYSENTHARTAVDVDVQERTAKTSPDGNRQSLADRNNNGAGAPPLDWWKVNTRGYAGSHYATYPPELIDRLIKSMTPPKVCTTCGEPSRRVVAEPEYVTQNGDAVTPHVWPSSIATAGAHSAKKDGGVTKVTTTTGWTDCGHDTWRRGVVLDPFAGSGTTLAVATGHGHDAIGIDLDERNADLAAERVGMFLVVERDGSDSTPPDEDAGLSPAAQSCTAATGHAVDTPDISYWPERTA